MSEVQKLLVLVFEQQPGAYEEYLAGLFLSYPIVNQPTYLSQ